MPVELVATALFVCAVAGALVAPRKGESPMLGFLAGLLTGPIGLGYLVTRPDVR